RRRDAGRAARSRASRGGVALDRGRAATGDLRRGPAVAGDPRRAANASGFLIRRSGPFDAIPGARGGYNAAMTRLILIEAILFLIPFALYFVWRAVLERKEAATGGRFNERPWQMLIVAGGVLAIGGLIAFAFIGSGRGDSVYIPAYVEDG